MCEEIGVATVPGSSFYSPENKAMGSKLVRFAFCKKYDTLKRAAELLGGLRAAV
jgi:aspartate/methionine/tyrosine aminotransferase